MPTSREVTVSRSPDAPCANQSAPAALPRGSAEWRADLAAYDALPEELRRQVQDAPFELDAAGLLEGLRAAERRYGSKAMAIAAMGAQIGRFTQAALEAAAQEDARPRRAGAGPARQSDA